MTEHAGRPLLIYDGDCGFCRFWIDYWQRLTGGQIDYAPSQEVGERYPQIPPERFRESVQLVLPSGEVRSGAEAVFLSLRGVPGKSWMLWAYQRFPGFAPASECAYAFVASHRNLFAKTNRILWGKRLEPPSFELARWVFLRLLAACYFFAFLSLWGQIPGLVGVHGILPVGQLLDFLRQNMGAERYWEFPTLAWLNSSDAFLQLLAGSGVLLSMLAGIGLCTGPLLACLWLFYLSIVTAGQDFLGFQWDGLLLEAGFLAIFFAPWQVLESHWRATTPNPTPSLTFQWLLMWLLFRLMFMSGVVKFTSGDPTWRNLTALDYHYYTQPLPTPVAWYMQQLPEWFQKASVVVVFSIELGAPFLIFLPRRLRHLGASLLIALQALIAITGNYAFFNLLTVALCFLAFDNAAWRRVLPAALQRRVKSETRRPRFALFRQALAATLAAFVLSLGLAQLGRALGHTGSVPRLVRRTLSFVAPIQIVNSYGLFAVMTTKRGEIVIEGSNDGETWQSYEFKYKPGPVERRPLWVEPFQPRLDWQMWFAALGNYDQNRWFQNLMVRLLEGTPEVLALFTRNPFPGSPPRYIRAAFYDYRFTDWSTRRTTGAWWRIEPKGAYFPVASLRQQ